MNQYYLLELIPDNGRISINKLHKTEFTSPFCIICVILSNTKELSEVYFVLTNNIYYLSKFLHIENTNDYNKACELFYNKGNFACCDVHYGHYDMYFIKLSSKNFDKYYSFSDTGKLGNYNEIVCDILFYRNFSVKIEPLYAISKSIDGIKYYMHFLHENHEFSIKEFKNFNTFRDLVLNCIELDKKEFMSKHKDLSKNEKLIINEYYGILMDVAKGIEL